MNPDPRRHSAEALKQTFVYALVGMAASVTLLIFGILPRWTRLSALGCLAISGVLALLLLFTSQKALLAFLIRRFALMVVTLFGITMVTFIIIRAAPGDPTTVSAGPGSMGQGVDPAQMAREVQKSQRELLGMAEKYSFRAPLPSDPDGGEIQLVFNWGDGSSDTRSEFGPPGTSVEVEHAWSSEGTYRVRCQAVDKQGARSGWSDFAVIEIREKNEPPSRPILEGPAETTTKDKPTYTAVSQDPEGAKLKYLFQWDEQDEKEVAAAEAPSGQKATATYQWGDSGVYRVQARCQDSKGAYSDWSEPLTLIVRNPEEPLLRPTLVEAPSVWALRQEWLIRARIPESSPEGCALQFDFRDGTTWTSPVAAAGSIVEARHTFTKIPDNEKKEYAVRVTTVLGDKKSDRRIARVAMTEGNRAPSTPPKPHGPATGHLTRPLALQYLSWIWNCFTMKFGRSSAFGEEIVVVKRMNVTRSIQIPYSVDWNSLLPRRLLQTVKLEALAIVLIYLIAVPIGIYSSTHRRALLDRIITFFLFVLYSLPSFWVATMLIVFVGQLSLSDSASLSKFFRGIPFESLTCSEPDKHPFLGEPIHFFWHAILPVLCLTYGGLAALSRYARSGMLEVVRQDYIRTARAKGLPERVVILKHALRNGMIPILTLLANLLPYLIGGAIIIEFIFSIDGMGLLAFDAITQRDYNVVMAVTTLSAVMTLLGILISDILYVIVDPRISFESLESE